jgi:hypothetical protein
MTTFQLSYITEYENKLLTLQGFGKFVVRLSRFLSKSIQIKDIAVTTDILSCHAFIELSRIDIKKYY